MNNPFDRGHRTSTQALPVHDRRIYPTHSVELQMRSCSCIKESAALKHANGLFDGNECGTASIQQVIPDLQCGTQAVALR